MAIIQNINVSTPNDHLGDTLRDSQVKANTNFTELNAKKVEIVPGLDLSSNDFTDAEKLKLDGIDVDAGKNVQADWQQADNTNDSYIKNKPNLGSYLIMDGIIGVTAGFAVGQVAFTLPYSNAKALTVHVNGALQYMNTSNNGTLTNRWSQTGDVVTLQKTTVANNYIYIAYQ